MTGREWGLWLAEARACAEDQAGEDVELALVREERLSGEIDPSTGEARLALGHGWGAAIRLFQEGNLREVSGLVQGPEGLRGLLSMARAQPSRPAPPTPAREMRLPPLASGGASSIASGAVLPPAGALSVRGPDAAWLEHQGRRLLKAVRARPAVIQALFLEARLTQRALVRTGGSVLSAASEEARALVRCETLAGAVLEAASGGDFHSDWALEGLTERLREAVEVLGGPVVPADSSLPVVMRPAVAAALVSTLGLLLRGDVAAASPGLARARGRRLFPPCLTLRDGLPPGPHPHDAEGLPVAPLLVVERGELKTFLHDSGSAALLGAKSEARAQRTLERLLPHPEAFGLEVLPGDAALPEACLELVVRLQTFSTMPRAGTLSLLVAGWRREGGERTARLAPFELELPVLATLRKLRGVGADSCTLAGAERCTTPTLIFEALP